MNKNNFLINICSNDIEFYNEIKKNIIDEYNIKINKLLLIVDKTNKEYNIEDLKNIKYYLHEIYSLIISIDIDERFYYILIYINNMIYMLNYSINYNYKMYKTFEIKLEELLNFKFEHYFNYHY